MRPRIYDDLEGAAERARERYEFLLASDPSALIEAIDEDDDLVEFSLGLLEILQQSDPSIQGLHDHLGKWIRILGDRIDWADRVLEHP